MTKLELECKKTVLEYLTKQLRPYNAQNIIDNLHNTFTKKLVTTVLEELTDSGQIEAKTYGKCVIYLALRQNIDLDAQNGGNFTSNLAKLRNTYEELNKELTLKSKLERSQRNSLDNRIFREYAHLASLAEKKEMISQDLGEILKRKGGDISCANIMEEIGSMTKMNKLIEADYKAIKEFQQMN